MFSDTRIQQSSAVIAQAGVVGAVDTTKMAGQLLSRVYVDVRLSRRLRTNFDQSSGDSKAPANLQRYHSPTSRRKDLNPPRKHYQCMLFRSNPSLYKTALDCREVVSGR